MINRVMYPNRVHVWTNLERSHHKLNSQSANISNMPFSLEDIHRSLLKVEDSKEELVVDASASGVETIQAISSKDSTPFDDALQEYALVSRPTQTEHLEELVQLVARLAKMCGSDANDWKVFVLVAFRRRYPVKAPAARTEALKLSSTEEEEKDTYSADGDGERLIFYVTCLALHRYASTLRSSSSNEEEVKFVPRLCRSVHGQGRSRYRWYL